MHVSRALYKVPFGTYLQTDKYGVGFVFLCENDIEMLSPTIIYQRSLTLASFGRSLYSRSLTNLFTTQRIFSQDSLEIL